MKTKVSIRKIRGKIAELRKAKCNLFIVALRFLYYYLCFGKKIIAHQSVIIRNVKNIEFVTKDSVLEIGTNYRGFLTKRKETLINVNGTLRINGKVFLAQGVVLDVCEGGILELENKVFINSFTLFVCAERIVIGEGTWIGWSCDFLDTNFHESSFMGGKSLTSPIIIGKNNWIGSYVSIFKGVRIADECTIQEHSIIDRSFPTPNCTILTKREFLAIQGKKRES
jgi:acetyltransferase-like isoleucine patch superfamily enzyme